MRRVARWAILASCAALIPAFAHAQDATIKLLEDITYKAAVPGIPKGCPVWNQSQCVPSCQSRCRPA
jgi:hypothetical protein